MVSTRVRTRITPVKGPEPQRAISRPTLAPIKTCDDDQRWSAVVPPHSRALTFVAIFDPDEGMIGFSGNSLLPLEITKDLPQTPCRKALPPTPGFPHDATESQVLTTCTSTPAQSTPALSTDSTLRDMQEFLGGCHPGGTRWRADGDELAAQGFDTDAPRASSTLMGLHMQKVAPRTLVVDDRCREAGCDTEMSDDQYDERFEDSGYASTGDEASDTRESFERPQVDSFFVYDEYPFISNNERSHFSVTTTSTSNYVPVESPATPEPPATPHNIAFRPSAPEPLTPESTIYNPYNDDEDEGERLEFLSFVKPRPQLPHSRSAPPPTTPRKSNKLYKARSHVALRPAVSLPASPDVVLAREAYNFDDPRTTSPSSYSPLKPRLPRVLSKGIMRIRKLSNAGSSVRPSDDARIMRPSVDVRRARSSDDGHSAAQSDDTHWVCVDVKWQPRITQYDLDDDEI